VERVRGGAQRTGIVVCVKSKRNIDRSRVVHGFVEASCMKKNIYIQHYFWNRKPVQCVKQRGDVLAFAFSKDDACRHAAEAGWWRLGD